MLVGRKMKLSEYLKEAATEAAAAAGDADLLRALQARVLDAKAQAAGQEGGDPEVAVAVEAAPAPKAEDPIAALAAKVDALMALVQGMAAKLPGYPEPDKGCAPDQYGDQKTKAAKDEPAAPAAPEKQGGAVQGLAMEALDALLARYEAVKAKIAGGTITKEEAASLFEGEWDIKRAIEMGAAIIAKADKFAMVGEVVEGLKALKVVEAAPAAPAPEPLHKWPYDMNRADTQRKP